MSSFILSAGSDMVIFKLVEKLAMVFQLNSCPHSATYMRH